MTRTRRIVLGTTGLVLLGLVAFAVRTLPLPGLPGATDRARRQLTVPPGFDVTLWATGVSKARLLRFTPKGDLLVSRTRAGLVTLLGADRNGDGHPDHARTLLEGLDGPHGIDLHDGWLYVAEETTVSRVRFDAASGTRQGALARVVSGLPAGGNHTTRTLRFGPDGGMYVSIGSSCNVCVEEDRRRAAIVRYEADGRGEQLYATGLRNAVGFTFQPGTGALYATDNGRDLLGDDFPPCELDRVVKGGFYGWPFANGNRVMDPTEGAGHDAEVAASIPPVHAFRAHNAPLGLTFVEGTSWPAEYRGALLVALHGSWNRSTKDGYQVVALQPQPDGTFREKPFLSGFLSGAEVLGRPVDVAEGPDGAAYVSDDHGGVIWRVAYGARSTAYRDVPRTAGSSASAAPITSEERAQAMTLGPKIMEEEGCRSCHSGQPGAAPRLRGLAARYDVAALEALLAAPPPPMPRPEITAAQRHALAVWLHEQQP